FSISNSTLSSWIFKCVFKRVLIAISIEIPPDGVGLITIEGYIKFLAPSCKYHNSKFLNID
ncbi:MAG: hypothetical protein JST62_08015, partial [Bacteroidetes bacterium]|nr:hypothetical protein [Bacteroidota bacterium]